MRNTKWVLVIVVLFFQSFGFCKFACDFEWKPGASLSGVNGPVYVMTKWDPDGNGPDEEMLVVGGKFSVAGNVQANNIAAFDGNSWHNFSNGTDGAVYSFANYNGKLAVGGKFNLAGGKLVNNIATWDGSQWQGLGSEAGNVGMNGDVNSIAVYNGKLYVCGSFTTPYNLLAAWNGTSWESVASITMSSPFASQVRVDALTVWDNKLIMGGYFSKVGSISAYCIAAYNGSNWQTVGDNLYKVSTLTIFENQLVANSANSVVKLVGGTWQIIGRMNNNINCLMEYNGNLYAGGSFTTADYNDANYITVWNGSDWHKCGDGTNGNVNAIAVYKNKLIIGGGFTTSDKTPNKYIAAIDKNSCKPLGSGLNGRVSALTIFDGKLALGGNFTQAGHNDCNFISLYDGENFTALGGGMNNTVKALIVYNGQLIAGGKFTRAGETDANGIAVWDGMGWQKLDGGMNGSVNALAVYGDLLIAGGEFTTACGITVNYIAGWDGFCWQTLGTGMNARVNALTVYNGELYAGGNFTTAGGTSVNRIAKWDGSSWTPYSSVPAEINALAFYDNTLISGGLHAIYGLPYTTLWDGASVGNVYSLNVYNNMLISAGSFTRISCNNKDYYIDYIAAWDGEEWKPLYFSVDKPVYALINYRDSLVAGGDFLKAGDNISAYLAKWELNPAYEGDLNSDCIVNFEDYTVLADNWMKNCDYITFCALADIDINNKVDTGDLQSLSQNWLSGGNVRDCEFEIKPGQNVPGLGSTVRSLISWDSDGNGPAKPVIVAGGEFTNIASNTDYSLKHIAIWDGNGFYPLGNGFAYTVTSLAVYHNQLIAGGTFGAYIWDGNSWQTLNGWVSGSVSDFTIYDDKLIVAGNFKKEDDVNASRIAAWDGDNWHNLGVLSNGGIKALSVYNGRLIAGGGFGIGDFNGIAAWDGEGWHKLGAGVQNGFLYKLAVYDGNLIAAGDFSKAGEISTTGMAKWNGSNWSAVEGGGNATCLLVYNDKLIAGFSSSHSSNFSQWDGTTWEVVGNSVDGYVHALCLHNEELIVGGTFYNTNYNGTVNERTKVNKIAKWNGSRWKALGNALTTDDGYTDNPGTVYAFTVYNGGLVAGGSSISRIAKWNGSSWQAIGTSNGQVNSLIVYDGKLVAGGAFGGGQAVAYWTGVKWQALGTVQPTSSPVTALALYGDTLAAAFEQNRCFVELFNGDVWSGTGVTFGSGSIPHYICALTEYKGRLIAAGTFTSLATGTFPNVSYEYIKYITAFDGTQWQQIGEGYEAGDYGYALTVYNNDLIVGGRRLGSSVAVNKWNKNWEPLLNNISSVNALAVYKGELIVGSTSSNSTLLPSVGWLRLGPMKNLEGDLNHDCGVDEYDLWQFSDEWLNDGCQNYGNCNEADLNYDNLVDFTDFSRLAPSWRKE
ncbi:MAG: hypothetical protein A2Y12_07270 [Planctomycetes bacterium GWF2_42_9]|nr:MAG: hypothetical protein A2Y12_07270 [Planctomycetes bacterium GWF2_42_9]